MKTILPHMAAVLFICSGACFGQSCAITSPTAGQMIQNPQPLQLTALVSSAPSAYKLIWSVDYQRWASGYAKDMHPAENDYRDAWQGPWTVTWYSGLNGDGQHTVSGAVYDIFGTQLATCAALTFTVRIMGMSNQSVNAFPTSGRGAWGMKTFDGTNAQSIGNASQSIDGYPLPFDNYCGGALASSQTGGWQIPSFNTACFPNGQHQVLSNYYAGNITDPYMLSLNFTSSNVSGNNIGIPNHYSYQGSVVTFSTTGTLPAPLVAGCQYSSQSSPTNTKTATYSVASGVITVTLSTGCNLAPGTPVLLRNIHSSSLVDGHPLCDGFFSMATGSGTTFTVTAPAGCPNIGAANPYTFEVDVNPYFVNYIDMNTISVSAFQGGPAVTLANGGSGTHTVLQRVRSPYWGYGDFFNQNAIQNTNAPAYVLQLVTFSNGKAPMEIEVPYWEMHMLAGAATQSVCPKIKNTDLSFTTVACNATGLSYTEVDDGGISGVCSVDSSGNITPIMAGWCQVKVQCAACAAGGVSLPPVTVYIQVHSGSITFPHFTHSGAIANGFLPGNSFFPLSAWHLNVIYATPYTGVFSSWLGPMMQESNLNSSMITADLSNKAFGDPSDTACFSSSWPSTIHTYESAFAAQYGTYFEVGLETTHWGFPGSANLAALLNNIGYNRQSCLTGFLSQLVSEGRTWRSYGYDELNGYMAGGYPFRNPNLGSMDFPTVVVSNGVATYNVAEQFTGVWNQAAGTGPWIKMAGAVTNTCLNGWYPVTGITNNGSGYPVSFTTPSTCANGTYTESSAQLYHYWVSSVSPGGENAAVLPSLWGTPSADNTSGNACCVQGWGPKLTSIAVSGAVATFTMPGNAIPNGTAIRVHGSVNNLNVVAPITVINSTSGTFSIAYNSLFGALPSNGTYNSSNDANLYVTVDGNFPPTPFLSLRNLLTSVSGHPATTWPVLGSTFALANPAVRNWTGNLIGSDAANDYVPQPPYAIYGADASVWQWANYTQGSSGLITRGYQLQPRAMLWSAGLNFNRFCISFQFDPGCDHPTQLLWRPETLVAQVIAMLTLNVSALRLYNFDQNAALDYGNCCAWNSPGTGLGAAIAPYVSSKQWSAMAHTDALIKLREDTELQPPANKPYMGPLFLTDAHTSPNYGNELKILCASEMPYGTQTRALPAISGGSMLKYVLTGYSLTVKVLSGNPATDTDEFCSSPGRVTTYVALPPAPAVNPIDNITFAPPSPLPFGAAKFLIQVGYYPRAMQDDPVRDCTSACTIAVDHHNTNAWYRVIYANANDVPLSIGDPAKIPSQGLY
jgi:hypothetical protein